jgi:hypothetical protein
MIESIDSYSYKIRKRKQERNVKKFLHGEIHGIVKGRYLTCLYIFVKGLYLSNSLGQLFILNVLLGHNNFHLYGFEIIRNILNGTDDTDPVYFPRVTMCDFKVREATKIHEHTVQCVLPINFINEKVFIFLWFWFAFLSLVNLGDMTVWVLRSVFKKFYYRYIKYRIELLQRDAARLRKGACKEFVMSYLQSDNCLVLRIIESNSSDLVVSELINELWRNYKDSNSNDSYGGCENSQGEASYNYSNQYSNQYSSSFKNDRSIKNSDRGYSNNYGRHDSIDL